MTLIFVGGALGAGLALIFPVLNYINRNDTPESPEEECNARVPKRPLPSSGGAEVIAEIGGTNESQIP